MVTRYQAFPVLGVPLCVDNAGMGFEPLKEGSLGHEDQREGVNRYFGMGLLLRRFWEDLTMCTLGNTNIL